MLKTTVKFIPAVVAAATAAATSGSATAARCAAPNLAGCNEANTKVAGSSGLKPSKLGGRDFADLTEWSIVDDGDFPSLQHGLSEPPCQEEVLAAYDELVQVAESQSSSTPPEYDVQDVGDQLEQLKIEPVVGRREICNSADDNDGANEGSVVVGSSALIASSFTPIMQRQAVNLRNLLTENPEIRDAITALAQDPKVWDACMANEQVQRVLGKKKVATPAALEAAANTPLSEGASEEASPSDAGKKSPLQNILQSVAGAAKSLAAMVEAWWSEMLKGAPQEQGKEGGSNEPGVKDDGQLPGTPHVFIAAVVFIFAIVLLKRLVR